MSEVQAKLNEGFSKLKKGVEKGKQSIQIAQEISGLKNGIKEAQLEKSKIILELGQKTYQLLREKKLSQQELVVFMKSITELDKKIYGLSKDIELKKQNGKLQCDCGQELPAESQFCGACGKNVLELKVTYTSKCFNCEEPMPESAKFCGCCGAQMIEQVGGV